MLLNNWVSQPHEVRQIFIVAINLMLTTAAKDYSTYHPFWVRRQARAGVDVGEVYDEDYGY